MQHCSEGHGGTIIAIPQTLMGCTLLALIRRMQMELNGIRGMDTIIH